jgi:toxin FitB
MTYLLDTNVVSELRKAKAGKADPNVATWAARVPLISLFISVITVQELEIGVLLAERRDAAKGALLRSWLEGHVLPTFTDRILPIDTAVARRSATLHVPDPRPVRDVLIAATALVHSLTVVTRNVSDFEPAGVKLFDPWSPAHGGASREESRRD